MRKLETPQSSHSGARHSRIERAFRFWLCLRQRFAPRIRAAIPKPAACASPWRSTLLKSHAACNASHASRGSPRVRSLVLHRVACALSDRLSLPLRDRSHDVDHEPASSRTGVQGLCNRRKAFVEPLPVQFERYLHLSRVVCLTSHNAKRSAIQVCIRESEHGAIE